MRYQVVYKCQLCGSEFCLENSVDMNERTAIKVIEEAIRNQRFAGNPYLYKAPMYVICECADGSKGMAVFAGLRKVSD